MCYKYTSDMNGAWAGWGRTEHKDTGWNRDRYIHRDSLARRGEKPRFGREKLKQAQVRDRVEGESIVQNLGQVYLEFYKSGVPPRRVRQTVLFLLQYVV